MLTRPFTIRQLVELTHAHLTTQEFIQLLPTIKDKKHQVISDGFWSKLWRRLRPGKIFFLRFKDNSGLIIMAENEDDACLEAVPFLLEGGHHCKNPAFNPECAECNKVYSDLVERLNTADVTWLGWGCPDYNWVIHV